VAVCDYGTEIELISEQVICICMDTWDDTASQQTTSHLCIMAVL